MAPQVWYGSHFQCVCEKSSTKIQRVQPLSQECKAKAFITLNIRSKQIIVDNFMVQAQNS